MGKADRRNLIRIAQSRLNALEKEKRAIVGLLAIYRCREIVRMFSAGIEKRP